MPRERTSPSRPPRPQQPSASSAVPSQESVRESVAAKTGPDTNFDVAALQKMKVTELYEVAKGLNVESVTGMKKQDLIFTKDMESTPKIWLLCTSGNT